MVPNLYFVQWTKKFEGPKLSYTNLLLCIKTISNTVHNLDLLPESLENRLWPQETKFEICEPTACLYSGL